jgi:hypothetical protein
MVHVKAASAQEDYGGGTKEKGNDETGVGEVKATAQLLLWPATPSKCPGSTIGSCGSCFGGCPAGSCGAGGIEVAAVVAAAGIVDMLTERGLATIVRWNRFIGPLQRRHGSTSGLIESCLIQARLPIAEVVLPRSPNGRLGELR